MAPLSTPAIGLQATAVVAGSFLSGAMMGLAAVTVPVFLDTDTEPGPLLAHFVRLYHYGHRIMPTLAVGTTTLYSIVCYSERLAGKSWYKPLMAGLLTIGLVPFTWVTMTPTNYALFDLYEQTKAGGTSDLGQVQGLVIKWNVLHVFRSLFPLVGATVGGLNVLRQLGF